MPLFGSSSSSDEDFPQPRKSKTPRGLARFKNAGSQSGIPSNNSCSSSRHVEPSSTRVQSSSVNSHVDATSCPGESSGRGTGASLARSSSQASAVRLGLDGSSTPSRVVSDVRTGSTTVRSLSRQTPLFVFSSPSKLRHQRLSEDDDTDMEITLETEPESTDDDSTCDEAATLGSVEERRPCKQDSGRTASPAASDEVVPESEAENEDSDEEMDLQDDPYSQSLFCSEGPRQSQIGTGRDSKRSAGQSCEAERTVVEETESSEACGDEDSDETMEPASPPDVSMSMPTGSCAVREHGPVWESGPQSELSLNKSGSRTSSIGIHSAEERLKDAQVVSEHFGSVCPGQPKKVLPGTDSMISRLKKWGSEFKERVQSKGASFTLAASTISNKKANKNLTASDDDELVLISEDEEGDRACTALKAEHVPVSMEEQSITESDEELLSISVETEASEDFQRATQTSAQPDTSSASTTSNISTLATITTRVETREPSRKRNASGQEVTGPGSGGSFAKRRHVSTPSQSTLSGHSDQSTLSKQNSILSSSTVKNKASGPSQSDLQSSTGTSVRGTPGRSDLQSSTGTSMRATPCRSNLQGKPSSAVGAAGAGEGSSLSVPADEKFPVQVKTEPGVGVASAAVPWPMYSQEHRVIIISDSEEDDDSDTERESSPSLLSVKQEEELHSEYATDSNGDLFSDPDSDVEIYHSEAEEEHPNMSYGFSPREDHNTASPPTCHEDESVSGEEDRQPRRASIKADASENQEAALSRIKSEPFDPVLDGSSGEALSETQLRAPEHAREGSADARPGITDLLFREEMPASDVSRYVVNRYIINPDSYDDLSGPSSDLGFREEQATAPHPQPQSGDAGLLLGVQVKHESMDIDKDTHSMPPCDFPSHRTGRQPLPSTSSATASGGRNLPVYDEDSSRDIKIPGRVNSTLGDVPSCSSSAPWTTAVGASIIRGTLPIDNTAASPHQSLDKVSNQTVPMDSDYLAATQVDDSTVMRQSYNISTLQYRAACSVDATRSLGSNPAAVDGVCRDAQGANSSKNEAYEALTQVDPVSRKKRGRPLPPADVDRYDYDALTQVDSIGPWGDNPGNALELPGMERSAELRSAHEEEEDAYFPATQVDEVSSSLDSEEKPSTEAGDGDPYLASTQVDNRHSSQLPGRAMDKETLAGNSVLNDADVFSAATQVDRLAGGNSPRTSNMTTSSVGRNAEEDEDEDYFAATQVDPQVSSSRNTDKSAYLEPTLCNADDTCSNDSAYLDQTQVDDDNDWLYHEPTQLDPAPTSLKLSKLVPHLSSKKDKERQVKAQLIEPLRQPMTAKSIRQKLQSRRQSTSRPEPAAGSAASVQKDDRSSGGSGWLSKPKSQAPKRKSSSSKAPKTKKRKRKSSPEGMSMTQQIKAATVAKNRRSSKTQGTKPKDKGTPAVPDAGDLLDVEPPNTQDVYALGLPLLNLPRIICKLKEHLATATTETPGPVTPGPSQRGDGTKGPSHQDAGSSKDGSRASGHSSVRESRFEPVTSLGTGFQVSALPDSSDKGKSFLSKSESGARLPASSSSKDKTSSLTSKASSSSKASDAASTNHRSSSNLPKTYDVMGGILAKMSRTGSSGKSRNSFDGMEGSMASKKPVGLPLVNAMPVLDKLPSQAARMVGQVQDPPAPAPLVPLRLVSSVPAAVTDMGSSLEGEVRASQSEPQPSTMQAAASSVSCRGGSAGWNQDPRLAQRPAQVSSRELSGLQDPNSGSGGVSSSSTCTTASTTSSSSSTTASTTSSSTSAATSTTSSSTSTAASTTKNSSIPITGISNKCTTTTSVVSNSSSSIAPSLPTQLAKSLQRGLSAVEQPATPRSAPMAPGNPSLPLVSGPPNSAVSHLRQAASDQPKLASILEARPRRAMSADARSSAMLPSLPPGVPSTSILQHGLQGCKKSWQLPVLDLRARPDLGRRVSADQPRNEKGGLSMNDFYFRLVKWNTVWLEEQEMQRLAPPVAKQCFPLVDSYTSLYEYQDIMMNLLLYETWEDVSRDWSAHRTGSFQLKMNLERYSKETPDMLKLTWIGLENWRCGNQAADLQQGTLAIVKWKEKMEGGKKGLSQRFAYIKEKSMMPAGLKIHYPALNKLPQATDPNVLVRVTMLMRDNYNCSPFIGTIVDVELVCNIMTRVRQASALCYLQHSPLQQDILSPADLKSETFRWPSEKGRRESGNLNPQQAKVVNQMMEVVTNKKRKFIGLLQGPPGTGKSFTIVSLISRIYLSVKKRNPSPSEPDPSARVLLAAPSNNAINELVRRLINARESDPKLRNLSIVRIGRSGQLDSKINQHSLDSRVQELWRRELEVQQQSLPESVRAQMDRVKERVRKKKKELESCQPADRRMVEGDIKKLNTELQKLANGSNSSMQTNGQMSRRKEDELKQKALKEAHVVCGTLNSFGNDRILSLSLLLSRGKGSPFVCAIVDEATQALEVDSLIPLQYDINTLLLVGDQEQLPATCMSKKAEEQNFGMSLFERCFKLFKDRGKTEHMHMLNMQHRMNPEVCHFPNKHVYNDKLVNHSVVLEPAILFHLHPYLLFDLDSSQEHSSQPGSISNQSEAEFTAKLCQTIRREQSRYSKEQSRYTVAVICPYRTQCDLIRRKNKERAFDDIEVGTVDSFQGQERDIIILSCVRANSSSGTIGFLDNRKRMNVALTRACRAVYIVGHLSSLQVSPDWEALIRNARERKLIIHVQAGAEEEAAARILEPKTAALQS